MIIPDLICSDDSFHTVGIDGWKDYTQTLHSMSYACTKYNQFRWKRSHWLILLNQITEIHWYYSNQYFVNVEQDLITTAIIIIMYTY